jgi:hypothetical protein
MAIFGAKLVYQFAISSDATISSAALSTLYDFYTMAKIAISYCVLENRKISFTNPLT